MHQPRSVKYVVKFAQKSGIVYMFFCICGYTNVPFWAKIVHVLGTFIYPAVDLSGVHCTCFLSLLKHQRYSSSTSTSLSFPISSTLLELCSTVLLFNSVYSLIVIRFN